MTTKELLVQYAAGKRFFVSLDISNSNLSYSNLRNSELRNSNLRNSNLSCCNLRNSDLRYSDLRNSDLRYSDLRNSELRNTDLRNSDLRNSNLSCCNLRYSDLRCCKLSGSNLTDAKLPYYQVVPEVGAYTAFKKLQNNLIAELFVPADAKRTSSLVGRQCRAEFADVVKITDKEGNEYRHGFSQHDSEFVYEVGKRVFCKEEFNDDIRIECASGIHHFNNRREAEEY